ncbi:ferrochelatase [Anaplasmataceae bacterium AB001_6]|nr:ferrochelatase [Anaplasmataceae bacterium AB001_6]
MSSDKKKAVLLFNLGGPDSLDSIESFLFNLFNDKYILTIPKFFRFILAKIISKSRKKAATSIYNKMGGKSPILDETKLQAKTLELMLNLGKSAEYIPQYKVFVAMRHWHPFFKETIQQIKNFDPDEVFVLPLYPQYSTTTTLSFLDEYLSLIPYKTTLCCCYYDNEKYIQSLVEKIIPFYKDAFNHGEPIILFSAHSLPLKIVEKGDPYQWQIEQTTKLTMKQLERHFSNIKYKICYQSKIGPVEWLSPNTESVLKEIGDTMPVVIVPISFVSEHSETLVELDIDYKPLVKHYYRVPTVSTNPTFIESLADIIKNKSCRSSCPKQHTQCWQKFMMHSKYKK